MSSVTIVSYSKDWPLQFAQVRAELVTIFADIAVEVEHIGSTSVPGLAAKPVIDVLLGADSLTAVESKTEALERSGYRYVSRYEHELPTRRYFVKAERTSSLRVHLHAVVLDSSFWHEHIAFRNALRSDSSLLSEYHSFKIELAARFPNDKSSYAAAKAPFIWAALTSLQQGKRNQMKIDLTGVQGSFWHTAPSKEIYPGVIKRELWAGATGAKALMLEFAPGAAFTETDEHFPGPEEVFVVSGVFNDGVSDYPAGSFIHCPTGSAHVPQSKDGCVLFVFFPEG